MAISTRIAPPYSVIIISELGSGEIPNSFGASAIAYTSSCIAIACRSEVEGITEITLSPLSEILMTNLPYFSGNLATPSGFVAVQTALDEVLLKMRVPSNQTRLSIWINDTKEPDKIIVGLDI